MADRLRYSLTIRLYGEDKIFGPGIAELLENVDRLHSLRKAAMEMGMAYSKAWTIIKKAEEYLSFPLLISTTGGKGGGGAQLSEQGRRFLKAYRAFEDTVKIYADDVFEDLFGQDSE